MASKSSSTPCDNAPSAYGAKVRLRELALGHVGTASVLDCFCGLGEMHTAVWRKADRYVGCDEQEWDFTGPPRFVCNNLMLLRALDLQQFNIFDLDAYGSPWEQAMIIASRRLWGPGENGAIVLTDGSSMRTRFGGSTRSMRVHGVGLRSSDESERTALAKWVHASSVNVSAAHRAYSNGSGKGGQRMTYTVVLFEGQPTS